MTGRSRKVEYAGHNGLTLRGILHKAQTEEQGAIILSHCFTCSKDFKIINWLSKELAALGHSVLRFDFAGLNASEGDFENTNLSTNIEDLLHSVEWLANQGICVKGLLGHSMGGTAAILTASRLSEIKSVIVMGTSSEVTGLKRLLSAQHNVQLESTGRITVQIGGKGIVLNREFFDDLYSHSVLETISEWNKALLILHGTEDRIVPIESGEEIFRKANQPKAFVAINDTGHLFSQSRTKARDIARIIASWVQLNGTNE